MKIEVKNVNKSFQGITILEDINVTLESGNIYGLIGRNGTGKSVFLKLLCAFYKPTRGEILFDGVNVIEKHLFPPSTRALIEHPDFLPDLTGYENLKLLASIQKKIGEKEILESLEKVNLIEDKDKAFHKYSLGMKQKLGIAQVIMEDPMLMILDEPFNGIEERTAIQIRKLLRDEKEKGKIIIIASHIKEDIIGFADKVYLFDDKKMIEQSKSL